MLEQIPGIDLVDGAVDRKVFGFHANPLLLLDGSSQRGVRHERHANCQQGGGKGAGRPHAIVSSLSRVERIPISRQVIDGRLMKV
jgi:hypothetical protein